MKKIDYSFGGINMKNVMKSVFGLIIFSVVLFSCKVRVETHEHTFGEWTVTVDSTEEAEGKKEKVCTVCGYKVTDVIAKKAHVHTIATDWSSNAEKHWHTASCGKEVHNEDEAIHTEDDGTVTAEPDCVTKGEKVFKCKICNVFLRSEDIPAKGHTEDEGTITTTATFTSVGVVNYKCTDCNEELGKELYCGPFGEDGNTATASSTYVYFGVFPKTVKASTITVNEEEIAVMGPNTYYKGSDGEWYAKIIANPNSSSYKYSDGTTITKVETYFKVEPIKWKVLTADYNETGNTLLLAEDVLTGNVPYYVSTSNRSIGDSIVYANNYKYSTMRAYLNGKYEDDDTQPATYENTGLLQTAFSTSSRALIAETNVINTAETTGYSEDTYATTYACKNTTDKIFLLSESEVINILYGFGKYNSSGTSSGRIRVTTDYARANYAQYTNDSCTCFWWLRSPADGDAKSARYVDLSGYAGSYTRINGLNYSIVPALTISLK